MADLLVRGGTVVDGTGAAPREADVRVRDGRIVEVDPDLRPDGEPEIDAAGAYVAPGIIDTHTHLDGAMWWDPDLDPLPGCGNTSFVSGYCGNSLAPLAGGQRDEIVDLLCFLEDLPNEAFQAELPWSWERWPQYAEAMAGQPTSVNVSGYCGHLSLRTYVMGDAAWQRAATPDERRRMAGLLDEALRHGAVGLSVNHFDKDRALRPVPGFLADDDEYRELLHVLAGHPGRTLQFIIRFNEPELALADTERFVRLATEAGVRTQSPGVTTNQGEDAFRADMAALQDRLRGEGADLWPNVVFAPLQVFYNFERSIAFQRIPAWHELVGAPAAAKRDMLASPEWRARARHDWDNRVRPASSPFNRPDGVVFASSETGVGPVDVPLGRHARSTGSHESDCLADWLLANGLGSQLLGNAAPLDEDVVVAQLRDPRGLTNINDTGAHLQLFCAAGQHMYLLTHYVRDTGRLPIEEAVHLLTGRTAGFFGFTDRGVVAPGKAGDLIVFSLDEIDYPMPARVHDVPHGTWRFTRPPAGFRATVVGGTPTWLDGQATGARPGRRIVPTGGSAVAR
jgi:N-acyl-D-amino-acid deacylase